MSPGNRKRGGPSRRGRGASAGRRAAGLRAAFAATDVESVLRGKMEAVLVMPGDELASVTPFKAAAPSPPSADAGVPAVPRAGRRVRIEESGFVADGLGYLCIENDEVSVMSPIWVSPDKMKGYFILFPQQGRWRPPQAGWLAELLEQEGIRHGIQEAAVERLSQQAVDSTRADAFLLAEATPPVDGEDAHVEYSFDPDKRAGTLRPDGSIDLKERNAAVSVASGQLLGDFVAATQGRPGTNVLGVKIEARDGRELPMRAGPNVRTELEGGARKRYYAKIDGVVDLTGGVMKVNPVLYVNGDVDYDSGNIDAAGDVQISGSVRAGFAVKAGGGIAVGGTVESGAVLKARGDIIAAHGIVGETTRVAAAGNVTTRYIQNSEVRALGTVTAGSYVFNARVRAGSRVVVKSLGGRRGGSIVGGETIASESVTARRIGSHSAQTLVGISADPGIAAQLEKLREVVQSCDTEILRMLRTLNFDKADVEDIKELIRRAPAARKRVFIHSLKKLRSLGRAKERSLEKQQALRQEAADQIREGTIEVSGTVCAGVQVVIGDDVHTVSDDVAALVFYSGPQGVGMRPLKK